MGILKYFKTKIEERQKIEKEERRKKEEREKIEKEKVIKLLDNYREILYNNVELVNSLENIIPIRILLGIDKSIPFFDGLKKNLIKNQTLKDTKETVVFIKSILEHREEILNEFGDEIGKKVIIGGVWKGMSENMFMMRQKLRVLEGFPVELTVFGINNYSNSIRKGQKNMLRSESTLNDGTKKVVLTNNGGDVSFPGWDEDEKEWGGKLELTFLNDELSSGPNEQSDYRNSYI